MPALLTGKEINNAVMNLKEQGRRIATNVYSILCPAANYLAFTTPESVVFLEEDQGVDRLKFYTASLCDLKKALNLVPRPVTLELITKESEYLMPELKEAGFSLLARMRRLVNKDITQIMNRMKSPKFPRGGVALKEDVKEINRKLWATFDTRISHLLSDEELTTAIGKGEVLIVKEQGKIVTILQRTVEKKQFYINHVINESDKSCIHALMNQELHQFYDSGGRYMYAWVQDINTASNKFHGKYDMTFDGLYDLVYVNQ